MAGDAEDAIAFGIGGGGNTLGDFFLHHDGGGADIGIFGFEYFHDDGRGDIIGEICDNNISLGERDFEDIVLDDLDICGGIGTEECGEFGIELHGDYFLGGGGETLSEHAEAGADFEGGIGGFHAAGSDYIFESWFIGEKVLAERFMEIEIILFHDEFDFID